MDFIRKLWATLKSNPFFIAFEGGATGALLNSVVDVSTNGGHLDFSKAGLSKLATVAIVGGITAVRALYRPAPGTNPKP